MKVPRSIRNIYYDHKPMNERLKELVDRHIRGLKDTRWHYESRVKELVSFALKIETGRFDEPAALEDFFACTIVVANAIELKQAESLICEHFLLRERRPQQNLTHKAPESFLFDDLRLYVTVRDDPTVPPTSLSGITFEVQIKTFLQHAWAIATHDLVYKIDNVNWGKQRIAYQVKAMLEHAEISIQEAETLAMSRILAREDRRTKQIKAGIFLLKSQWEREQLPTDLRRLAENIVNLLGPLDLDIQRLGTILTENKAIRGGFHLANLSPYGTIVQYLFTSEQERMRRFLTDDRVSTKVLIPAEVELPPTSDPATYRNSIFVNTEL